MATTTTSVFFERGTPAQFEFVLSKYEETLRAKAQAKSSKPETLIKLDEWYVNIIYPIPPCSCRQPCLEDVRGTLIAICRLTR